MDRNYYTETSRSGHEYVALLAEGVDRNFFVPYRWGSRWRSPSSRRAWIEIQEWRNQKFHKYVALLAEGVDRNEEYQTACLWQIRSPSSRRAWIEIAVRCATDVRT